MPRISRLAMTMCFATLVCWQAGCNQEPERQTTQLLAEAPSDGSNYSSYTPKNPYKEAGENLLARTILETPGPDGMRIELRELFVTPGRAATKVSLPGPAILEVLGGEGKVTIGDNAQELTQGSSITLAQDATCSIESRGISPLLLRARVFIP
jgi:hypothetical protein